MAVVVEETLLAAGHLKVTLPSLLSSFKTQFGFQKDPVELQLAMHEVEQAMERQVEKIEKSNKQDIKEKSSAAAASEEAVGSGTLKKEFEEIEKRRQVVFKEQIAMYGHFLGSLQPGDSFGDLALRPYNDEGKDADVAAATCRGGRVAGNGDPGGAILGVIAKREYTYALAMAPARDLRNVACFDWLDEVQLMRLAIQTRKQLADYGTKVFSFGEVSDDVFLLKSGEAKLEVEPAECIVKRSRPRTVARIGPGVIDEAAADEFGVRRHTASCVVTSTSAVIYRIPRSVFLRFVNKSTLELLKERVLHRQEGRAAASAILHSTMSLLSGLNSEDRSLQSETSEHKDTSPEISSDQPRRQFAANMSAAERLANLSDPAPNLSQVSRRQETVGGRAFLLDCLHKAAEPQYWSGSTDLCQLRVPLVPPTAPISVPTLAGGPRQKRRDQGFEPALVSGGYIASLPPARRAVMPPRENKTLSKEVAKVFAEVAEKEAQQQADAASQSRAFVKIMRSSHAREGSSAFKISSTLARQVGHLQMHLGEDINAYTKSLQSKYVRPALGNKDHGLRANIKNAALHTAANRAERMKCKAIAAQRRIHQVVARKAEYDQSLQTRLVEMSNQTSQRHQNVLNTRGLCLERSHMKQPSILTARDPQKTGGNSSKQKRIFDLTAGTVNIQESVVPLTARF